jgi:hypothetical protein
MVRVDVLTAFINNVGYHSITFRHLLCLHKTACNVQPTRCRAPHNVGLGVACGTTA